MVSIFKELINDLRAITESITKEGIEITPAVIQYVLTLITTAVLIGVCFVCIYWGIDIVGSVGNYMVEAVAA